MTQREREVVHFIVGFALALILESFVNWWVFG